MNLPEFHTQHVFVASDLEKDRLLFQQAIDEFPYVIHLSTSNDGDDVTNVLDKLPALPDLIMLDLDLSQKNGLECLQEIKANGRLASIPVIIFAASSYPSVLDQAYSEGAHLYLNKPDDPASFKQLLQHVLSINWKEKILPPPRDEFFLDL